MITPKYIILHELLFNIYFNVLRILNIASNQFLIVYNKRYTDGDGYYDIKAIRIRI